MATEKRLIDANAIIEKFEEHRNLFVDAWQGFAYLAPSDKARVDELGVCIAEIINAPTVDAVEVVHGGWEITEDDYFDLVELKCSVCGESYGFENYEDCIPQDYHYCPNCGAKMDKTENL